MRVLFTGSMNATRAGGLIEAIRAEHGTIVSNKYDYSAQGWAVEFLDVDRDTLMDTINGLDGEITDNDPDGMIYDEDPAGDFTGASYDEYGGR